MHYKSLPSPISSICLFSEHSAFFSPWTVDALLVLKDEKIRRLTSVIQELQTPLRCRSILFSSKIKKGSFFFFSFPLVHYLPWNTAKCFAQQWVKRYVRGRQKVILTQNSTENVPGGYLYRVWTQVFCPSHTFARLVSGHKPCFVSVAQFPEDWKLGNVCTLGWRKWLLWRTESLLLCAGL